MYVARVVKQALFIFTPLFRMMSQNWTGQTRLKLFNSNKSYVSKIIVTGDLCYFFLLAGTARKTPGQNHTVINTSIKQYNNVRYLCRLHRRLYKDSPKKSKSGLRCITGVDVYNEVMMSF